MPKQPTIWNRREFLRWSGAAVSLAAAPPLLWAAPAAGRKTRHVVLIAFAGGVRSRDTVGTPTNVPNLMRLASSGVVYPNVGVANLGHYGATLSLFTGNRETFGIRERRRTFSPTVFEYLRRDGQLPQGSCWLCTNNGVQSVNFAYGLHDGYGARYGANVIDGDSLFNEEFRESLEQVGRARPEDPGEQAILTRLRQSMEEARTGLNDAATAARVEQYILDELTRSGTVRLTGPGAADAKALQVAERVLQLFRPRLLAISLADADIAHSSYNRYVDVIRRNDQQIGGLLDTIDADAELRDSTAVIVLPEFGRDRDLNQRNGLDHGDGSDDLNRVACIAAGPDFRKGKTVRSEVESIDVCPTICKLLGTRAKHSRGRPLPQLLT